MLRHTIFASILAALPAVALADNDAITIRCNVVGPERFETYYVVFDLVEPASATSYDIEDGSLGDPRLAPEARVNIEPDWVNVEVYNASRPEVAILISRQAGDGIVITEMGRAQATCEPYQIKPEGRKF